MSPAGKRLSGIPPNGGCQSSHTALNEYVGRRVTAGYQELIDRLGRHDRVPSHNIETRLLVSGAQSMRIDDGANEEFAPTPYKKRINPCGTNDLMRNCNRR